MQIVGPESAESHGGRRAAEPAQVEKRGREAAEGGWERSKSREAEAGSWFLAADERGEGVARESGSRASFSFARNW